MVIKFDLSIYNTKCLCVNIHNKKMLIIIMIKLYNFVHIFTIYQFITYN